MIDVRHISWVRRVTFLMIALAGQGVSALDIPSSFKSCGTVSAETILSGDRFMADGGQDIMLTSIKAPEFWEEGAAYRSWPHANVSKNYLAKLVAGKPLTLYCGAERADALGTQMRHVILPNNSWVQALMVQSGMAFVHPTDFSGQELESLFAAEQDARVRETGLWSGEGLSLLANSEDVRPGFYQIVDFTLHEAAEVGTMLYLNSAEDWRKDFTVEIVPIIRRKIESALLETYKTKGSKMEVRGWVFSKNGPTMRLTHPEQIRLLRE